MDRRDTGRRRLAEARGYHPRGRTLGEPGPMPAGAAAAGGTRRVGRGAPRPRGSATGAASAVAPAPARPANQGRRLRWASGMVMVVLIVLGGRLVHFQLSEAGASAREGLADRIGKVVLPAHRGAILDRDGQVLAGSADSRFIAVDPSQLADPVATAAALAPLLGVTDPAQLVPMLSPHLNDDGSPSQFEYLAREVPVSVGDAVEALNIYGVIVERDESRVVPGGTLAANVIGFTGRPDDSLHGVTGLEAAYDDVLRGTDGLLEYEQGDADDAGLAKEIPFGYRKETPAESGSDVQLTIDRDLQFEVQQVLGEKLAAAQADQGAAVVLDVRTGEVLAQASYPFYDAANPASVPASGWVDNVTGWALDPGSVHKAVVFAACLQEGVVTPTSTVLVPPTITKGDTTYTDTHYHAGTVEMTLPGILAYSSNVGTITLAGELGAQKLYDYQRAFGLGEPTGEGVPGEAPGLVQPPANWSGSSYGSIPIGLGVSVTPLQMAAVYAAIANGGVWVRPHIVKAVTSPAGVVTAAPDPPTRRVISAENAAALRTMLEAVVTIPDATGTSARLADYRVAGKTGTGKEVVNGQYAPGDVASFIGMAPADAPRYVIAIFAHTPNGEGGAVAGPAFAEMMQYTLEHYRVAPTGSPAPILSAFAP